MFESTMTDTELETVLAKASALSAFFREIGPKYDQENTFAYPSIKAFKDSGLDAVPVPKQYGGLGGDLLTTSNVVAERTRSLTSGRTVAARPAPRDVVSGGPNRPGPAPQLCKSQVAG